MIFIINLWYRFFSSIKLNFKCIINQLYQVFFLLIFLSPNELNSQVVQNPNRFICLSISINNSFFFFFLLNKSLNPLCPFLVICPFQFNYISIHSYLFLFKFQNKIKIPPANVTDLPPRPCLPPLQGYNPQSTRPHPSFRMPNMTDQSFKKDKTSPKHPFYPPLHPSFSTGKPSFPV